MGEAGKSHRAGQRGGYHSQPPRFERQRPDSPNFHVTVNTHDDEGNQSSRQCAVKLEAGNQQEVSSQADSAPDIGNAHIDPRSFFDEDKAATIEGYVNILDGDTQDGAFFEMKCADTDGCGS